jgi:hypothetical protein
MVYTGKNLLKWTNTGGTPSGNLRMSLIISFPKHSPYAMVKLRRIPVVFTINTGLQARIMAETDNGLMVPTPGGKSPI